MRKINLFILLGILSVLFLAGCSNLSFWSQGTPEAPPKELTTKYEEPMVFDPKKSQSTPEVQSKTTGNIKGLVASATYLPDRKMYRYFIVNGDTSNGKLKEAVGFSSEKYEFEGKVVYALLKDGYIKYIYPFEEVKTTAKKSQSRPIETASRKKADKNKKIIAPKEEMVELR